MPKFKNVDGVSIQMTPQEEANFIALEAVMTQEAATLNWSSDMENLDRKFIRAIEDIYGVLTQAQKDAMPVFTKNFIQSRVARRGQRP